MQGQELDPFQYGVMKLRGKVETLEARVEELERKIRKAEAAGERRWLAVAAGLSFAVIWVIYRLGRKSQ